MSKSEQAQALVGRPVCSKPPLCFLLSTFPLLHSHYTRLHFNRPFNLNRQFYHPTRLTLALALSPA